MLCQENTSRPLFPQEARTQYLRHPGTVGPLLSLLIQVPLGHWKAHIPCSQQGLSLPSGLVRENSALHRESWLLSEWLLHSETSFLLCITIQCSCSRPGSLHAVTQGPSLFHPVLPSSSRPSESSPLSQGARKEKGAHWRDFWARPKKKWHESLPPHSTS